MLTSQFHWNNFGVLSMPKEVGSDLDQDALQWSCPGCSDFSVSCVKESLNRQTRNFPPVVIVCHLEANSSTEVSSTEVSFLVMKEAENSKVAVTNPCHYHICKFFLEQGCNGMPGYPEQIVKV